MMASIRVVTSYSNRRKGVTCGLIYTGKCRNTSSPWTVYATYVVHGENILFPNLSLHLPLWIGDTPLGNRCGPEGSVPPASDPGGC